MNHSPPSQRPDSPPAMKSPPKPAPFSAERRASTGSIYSGFDYGRWLGGASSRLARAAWHSTLLGTALLALSCAPVAGAFTYEFIGEFHLSADLDGDSRADAVIVDKETGAFRVGYQTAPGVYQWAAARASGVANVSGAAAGRLLDLTRDQLVVVSPEANRLNLIHAENPAASSPPVSVFPSGNGPYQTVPVDIAGPGNTAHDDLVVTSTKLSPPNPFGLETIRNAAGVFSPIGIQASATWLDYLQPVQLAAAGPRLVAGLQRTNPEDKFLAWPAASGPGAPQATASVGSGQYYSYGRFNNHDRHHFLFFFPGDPLLTSHPVEPALTLGAGVTFDLGTPILQVVPLKTAPNQLLVLSGLGEEASVYKFDGSSAPQLLQSLIPPAGEMFSGITVNPDGSFLLYSGSPDRGTSANFHRYTPGGPAFTLAGSGALPALNSFGTSANVFVFAGEPFVAPLPVLLRTLNAADWSSKPDLSGANVLVQAERLGTAAQGLDNPVARDLGPKPPGATHALPNQYAPPISVASFQPAAGDQIVDIVVNPPPGPQNGAITVTLTAVNPPATLFWRTSASQPWASAANVASLSLFQSSEVEFFGQAGSRKSRIRRIGYTFPDPPSTQDSDGDGVPDFVEIAKGLNPNGGADSDADGYTDLEELLAGNDPLDVNDPPAAMPIPRAEVNAAFNLIASPRPYDGFTPGEVAPVLGGNLYLHTLWGSLLDSEPLQNILTALFNPAARFLDAPADINFRLLSLATDSHFDINSAGPSPEAGRELLSLIGVPELSLPTIAFTPGPGPLTSQADAWLLAAKTAIDSAVTPTLRSRLGVAETLAALLVEKKLEGILIGRGHPGFDTNRLTLFPFRPGDITRLAPTETQITGLESFGPGGQPAWNLLTMLTTVSNQLAGAPLATLRALATDVYRISSVSNNVAPGTFPLPVDVLRTFLDSGVLHSNYLAATTVSPADRATALTAANNLLIGLPVRPTNTFDLEVTLNSFQERCTTLRVVGSMNTRNLFTARQTPFKFPESFLLLPGSRVRVTAFTDFNDATAPCAGEDLQVISATLLAVPAPTLADTDGDFLPDDWECLFLGGVGDDSLADFDGDGKSNLQEHLDGTDPQDENSGAEVAVDLSPPEITITVLPGGETQITWQFPAGYADDFVFTIQMAGELGEGFVDVPVDPTYLGNGLYELILPASEETVQFFILQQLKP